MPAAALPVLWRKVCERWRIRICGRTPQLRRLPLKRAACRSISSAGFDRGIKARACRDIERQIARCISIPENTASLNIALHPLFGSKREWTGVLTVQAAAVLGRVVGCLKRQHQPGVIAWLAPAHERQAFPTNAAPLAYGKGNCRLGEKHHAEARHH